MPIHHAIWTVGANPTAIPIGRLNGELQLEEMIVREPGILSEEWMLIGRQESTGYGGRIDLLAIAPDGSLVLIEIKRDRTPREVVAQSLDYAAWVENLTADRVAQIYHRFSGGGILDEAFQQRFGFELDEESLNQSHQVVIVASELDSATERILDYLNERDVPINVLFFQVFQHGDHQLLSRAWMIDPGETQVNVASGSPKRGEREPWNGEFYASFGEDRNWEAARALGFISGGGGTWYSQTLKLLSPGDRVWVNIPRVGYVGVGRVVEPALPAREFSVQTPEGERGILTLLDNPKMNASANDPEKTEYFVRLNWLDAVPISRAINEVGLFGNQNTVCRPTTPKWRHTVERLKTYFTNWDADAPSQGAVPGR